MKEVIYAPILKAKEGEFAAYGNLTQNDKKITFPIFETKPFLYSTLKETTESQKIEETLIKHIKKYCSNSKIGIDLKNNMQFLREIRTFNSDVIPILELKRFIEFEDKILKTKENISSFIIRIKFPFLLEEAEDFLTLKEVFKNYSTLYDINLLLDFEEIIEEHQRRNSISDFKKIIIFIKENDFDTKIIISSSSLPKNLDCVEAGKSKRVDKLELNFFKKIKEAYKGMKFIYSDYGISKNVDYVGFFPKNSLAKIRYTLEEQYLLFKGRNESIKTKATKIGYKELLKTLIDSKDFMGIDFSDGDKKMSTLFHDEKKKGRHGDVIEYGTNHHITVILRQLSQYYEI